MAYSTPKKRAAIYRKAAKKHKKWEKFPFQYPYASGICRSIENTCSEIPTSLMFPELFLFKPKRIFWNGYWFDRYDQKTRSIILLFAAEIALNPQEHPKK